jgi:hypothetical protein
MRRRAQDRGATCGRAPVGGAGLFRLAAVLGGTLALVGWVPYASAAAPAGCAGKPGSPDRGALLQYCPQQANSSPSAGGTSTGTGTGGAGASSSPSGKHSGADGGSGKSQVPLTSYPSTGGINLMLIGLIVVALGLGVAFGARRWRRGRPQVS